MENTSLFSSCNSIKTAFTCRHKKKQTRARQQTTYRTQKKKMKKELALQNNDEE